MQSSVVVSNAVTQVGVNLTLSTREFEDLYHYVRRQEPGKRPRTKALRTQLLSSLEQGIRQAGINTRARNR
jgi:hypothetical protein